MLKLLYKNNLNFQFSGLLVRKSFIVGSSVIWLFLISSLFAILKFFELIQIENNEFEVDQMLLWGVWTASIFSFLAFAVYMYSLWLKRWRDIRDSYYLPLWENSILFMLMMTPGLNFLVWLSLCFLKEKSLEY